VHRLLDDGGQHRQGHQVVNFALRGHRDRPPLLVCKYMSAIICWQPQGRVSQAAT
jgi:hypothetical protein